MHRDMIEAGFRVFPLYRIINGICECGETDLKHIGKHPRASNWQNTPEWDDEQIENMEEAGFFDTGYGVVCKGWLVIDVDARNGGIKSYEKLLKRFPEISGCGFVVMTGSGGGSRHLYFRAPEPPIAMMSHIKAYPGIDFKTSGYVVGPGSSHASGGKYIADGEPWEIGDAPAGLIELLQRPERHRTEFNGTSVDLSHGDIEDILNHIPNADLDYDEWIKVGMAVHNATGGTGYDLWETWSEKSGKHDASKMDAKWHSFGRYPTPVTIGTLIYMAEQNGWKMPVTFGGDGDVIPFDFSRTIESDYHNRKDGLPFDIDGIDLTAPPGFVGSLARWIEEQSRRPRKRVSVGAALSAMGNIAGLRYTDDLDGVTSNLFVFCVAGSRTGKEAVQQAEAEIHRAAGIGGATHGSIKSEQEIVRNLVRHQAAFYIIDEIGILLEKIKNAQKRGGAAYLDGVIGMLMAAYSKANKFMLLTGDMKEDVRSGLLKELSQIEKRHENNEDTSWDRRRAISIRDMLANLEQGLERPFLSVIGYTTPVTFDHIVDYDMATNGFIGRSLIFNERDTAPRSKPQFRPSAMPDSLKANINRIAWGDSYDTEQVRIEYYGERKKVPTDAQAASMLACALDWLEDQAESQRDSGGLEALWLGAYELVSKVSLILAVPEGLRTSEHVRWAFALVKKDVEDKIRMVMGNDLAKDAPKTALRARIEALTSGDTALTAATLINRLRGYRRDDVLAEIASLVEKRVLEEVETHHKRTGAVVMRYRLMT